MNGIYEYVMKSIEQDIVREDTIKGIVSNFGVNEIYVESNLGFYFDEENSRLYAGVADEKYTIHVLEIGEMISEVKEIFFDYLESAVYNIYTDIENEPVMEIAISDFNKDNNLYDYIFETIKEDIECCIYELNVNVVS